MTEKEIKDLFEKNKENFRWKFCTEVLYEMCKKKPKHEDPDIIASKFLIIGRTYAAAVERNNGKDIKPNDDFYYDDVVKSIMGIKDELDESIWQLNKPKGNIKDNIKDVLETHYLLMDKISFEMSTKDGETKKMKRSLASKYLHFHCPEMFFIYDERAKQAVNKILKSIGKLKSSPDNNPDCKCDKEYKEFVYKCLTLQEILGNPTPQEFDGFLLFNCNKWQNGRETL